jgi:hypothetical protein
LAHVSHHTSSRRESSPSGDMKLLGAQNQRRGTTPVKQRIFVSEN